MYNQQLLHFIGIGGVGMAGIAEVLLNLGYRISGSDLKNGQLTTRLQRLGAQVEIGHRAENVPAETSVVVISSAIGANNPELQEAHARGIPVIPRAEMLAELMRMKYGIAVAGSHGKTTTTSMTAKVLRDIGHDPTVIVGGRILSQESGALLGTGPYLVAEADESDGSFCFLRPAIAIVTNVDSEHLSHYGSFGALEESFRTFLSAVPFYGLIVLCADCSIAARLADGVKRRVITYGLAPGRDIYATDIVAEGPVTRYELWIRGERAGTVRLPMSGAHMVSNSLAAVAVGLELGGYPEEVIESLAGFAGVSRRTERIAEIDGVLILDDYGHHPSEISATIRGVRQGWLQFQAQQLSLAKPGRLMVLFEPHRYTRTKELFTEFLGAFAEADRVVVGEIYPAGEEPIPGITGEVLADSLSHPDVAFSADLKAAVGEVVEQAQPGDVVLTLGAGAVGGLARILAEEMSNRRSGSQRELRSAVGSN